MKINIYASELATILGINPYQKISEYLIKLWEKNNPLDYDKTLDIIEKTHNIKFSEKINDLDNIKNISKENGIDIKKLEECLNATNTKELQEKKQILLKELSEKISAEKKKEFEKQLESLTNKNFGINNENNALELYKMKTGKTVLIKTKYISKKLCIYNNVEWYIGGKIDGITEDNIVIEIKNRIYKLFGVIREYEKPQLQAYMYILGLQKGNLVENLKNGNSDINIIEENFDEEYWNTFILKKLNNFIKLYNLILEDINMKIFIITEEEEKKEQFLKKMINM